MDTVDSAITKSVRRLEVFTGAGRRRTWSDEDKARVVAEIQASGDSVSGVARRHGLSPQQLFGWRRQVKEAQAVVFKDDEPGFVPAVVDAAPSDSAGHLQRNTPRRQRDEPLAGMIEVAIDGVTVRIGPGAPADTIAAVLRALKAGA
jgi:transposase